MSELYERLSEAIEAENERGYSIVKIANKCGISRQAVYQWKQPGMKFIDGANLVELAEMSGLNAKWIVTGKGSKVDQLTSDELIIVKGFRLLNTDMREEAILLAKRRIDKDKSIKMNAA